MEKKNTDIDAISDQTITDVIQMKYMAETATFKMGKIQVKTRASVVYLSGYVPNNVAKERAISIARSTDGVEEVVAELAIAS